MKTLELRRGIKVVLYLFMVMVMIPLLGGVPIAYSATNDKTDQNSKFGIFTYGSGYVIDSTQKTDNVLNQAISFKNSFEEASMAVQADLKGQLAEKGEVNPELKKKTGVSQKPEGTAVSTKVIENAPYNVAKGSTGTLTQETTIYNGQRYTFEVEWFNGVKHIFVGTSGQQSLNILQAAINMSTAGGNDKILVHSGTYGTEAAERSQWQSLFAKSDVTLLGGYDDRGTQDIANTPTIIWGAIRTYTFNNPGSRSGPTTGSNNVEINGFEIRSIQNFTCIMVSTQNNTCNNIRIYNNTLKNYNATLHYSRPTNPEPNYIPSSGSAIGICNTTNNDIRNNIIVASYATPNDSHPSHRLYSAIGMTSLSLTCTGTIENNIFVGTPKFMLQSGAAGRMDVYDWFNGSVPRYNNFQLSSNQQMAQSTNPAINYFSGQNTAKNNAPSGYTSQPMTFNSPNRVFDQGNLTDQNTGRTYDTSRIIAIFKEILENKDNLAKNSTGGLDPSLMQKIILTKPSGEGTLATPAGVMPGADKAHDMEVALILANIVLNPTEEQKEMLATMESLMNEVDMIKDMEGQKELKDISEEFTKATAIILVAQALPGLLIEADFTTINQAMMVVARDQKALYNDYLEDTEGIYNKLAQLLQVYIDKDKLPQDFVYFTVLSDKAKQKLLVDMALEKLKTKDPKDLTKEEAEALNIEKNTLAPKRTTYLDKLKLILQRFVFTVNEVLRNKESVSVKENTDSMKALFLLNKSEK